MYRANLEGITRATDLLAIKFDSDMASRRTDHNAGSTVAQNAGTSFKFPSVVFPDVFEAHMWLPFSDMRTLLRVRRIGRACTPLRCVGKSYRRE